MAGATAASAQVYGTFTWQMQPYCNKVTLTLTSLTGNFILDGFEDQCGTTNKASAVGVATFNAVNNVTLNFTIVPAPSGKPVHVSAVVSPADGSGTWTDSVGNFGTFAFFGNVPGLPARPLPPSGIAPAVITNVEIANDAITGAKVANGSLASVDLLDSPRAAFAGGLQELTLTAAPLVVRSVSLVVPAGGTVVTHASALGIAASAAADSAQCSLTETTFDFNFRTAFGDSLVAATSTRLLFPVALTRGFTVAAAGTFTVNFICRSVAGTTEMQDSSLTATYFPAP
jgi:hypothetical protein